MPILYSVVRRVESHRETLCGGRDGSDLELCGGHPGGCTCKISPSCRLQICTFYGIPDFKNAGEKKHKKLEIIQSRVTTGIKGED